MRPMCLSLLCLVPLRIMALLMVLAPISTEWVIARSMPSSKSSETFCYHSRVDSQILTTTSRPSVKPFVWSPSELPVLNRPSTPSLPRWRHLQHRNHSYRKCQLAHCTHFAKLKRMRRPSPAVPTRQDPGTYLHIVTAPQPLGPLGPMAHGHQMTVEIRVVGMIRSQAPKMNKHEVPFYYGSLANNTTKGLRSGPAFNKLVRIHCKAGSVSVRLVFETRAKCQDFIARYKDDGITCAINSPFCCTNTNITVRQSKSIEDREIGKQFAPLWREFADQLRVLFPDGDNEGAFIIPALDARSQVLSIKDRRN